MESRLQAQPTKLCTVCKGVITDIEQTYPEYPDEHRVCRNCVMCDTVCEENRKISTERKYAGRYLHKECRDPVMSNNKLIRETRKRSKRPIGHNCHIIIERNFYAVYPEKKIFN